MRPAACIVTCPVIALCISRLMALASILLILNSCPFCSMRRAFSLGDTFQLPEWKTASGLATPFGQFMREAHDRRSQGSSQNHDTPLPIPEDPPHSPTATSPGRRSPRKSMSELSSPRSSNPESAALQSSSGWVSTMMPRAQAVFVL